MRDDAVHFDHPGSAPQRSSEEIQDWMVTYIAREMGVAPEQVDVSAPFENFALDSATAIGMTGDLESWLGQRIDPTLVYDYPTIEELSKHLDQRKTR